MVEVNNTMLGEGGISALKTNMTLKYLCIIPLSVVSNFGMPY